MASFEVRKTKAGGKRIRVTVKVRGCPRIRRTFTTMASARDWAYMQEVNLRNQSAGVSTRAAAHTVAEMIERYIEKVLPHKTKKKRYIRQQTQQLNWWKKQLGGYTLANLSKPLLIEKRDDLLARVDAATVNRYLAALSHVFTIAITEWEWLDSSPLAKVKKLKESRGRHRYLKEEERPTFLDACKLERRKPLFLIVVLCIATGARKEEITALPLKNVDLVRGTATIEETKNSEPKTFFITGFALQLLRDYVAAQKLFKRRYLFSNRTGKAPILIDREFRRARDRAGVDDFVLHDLRHTHASYLAMEAGADTKMIAESLGQKTLNQANRYTHLTRRHVADKVEKMNDKIFGTTNPKGE